MKRPALLSIFIVVQVLWCLAMTAFVAGAANCANKWSEPKEVAGKGAKKADAIGDFEKESKTLAKDANCKADKCAKGNCRALRTATQSCSGDDEKGWKCTGMVRVGCFCLEPKETGKIAPTPSSAPTPTDAACSNKFDEPKEAQGISDQGAAQAQTGHDDKIKEYIKDESEFCAKLKCTGEKKACRLYYTTTPPKPDSNSLGWSVKSQFRGGCFCFGADEEALAMASGVGLPAGEEFAAHRPFTGKTMLVGIVLAEGCLPNHTCTASLVANTDAIEGTPGVKVEKVRVPERLNARGHATLQGIVVASNQAKRQPADGPITFITPETGAATAFAFDVALADQPEEPVSLPIDKLPPSHGKHHDKASAPPVLPDNGVCVVHDKFSGNGHATKVAVNGTDVPVLAESQEVTVFRPGSAAKAGDNEYTLTDNGVTKTYKLAAPSVSISASQTTLEQNQSAQFQVTVSLPASSIPDSSWSSSDGEGQGGEGYVLLTIKNDSPSTTTISGGNPVTVTLHKSDLASGTYTYNGTVTAQQPGAFQIEAIIEAHLAEAAPINTAGGVKERRNIARGAATGCCQYNNPASGSWCAIETESECLGTWKGPKYGCNQSGTCGLNIPLGGNDKSEIRDKQAARVLEHEP